MKAALLFALCCSVVLSSRAVLPAEGDRNCPTEAFPGVVWDTTSPQAKVKWNSERLHEARQYSDTLGTAAIVIVQCGAIVDEWGKVDGKFRIASVRKSLLSALFGIYNNDGEIDLKEDLESIGLDDITHLTEPEKEASILDLIMSRSGVYLPAAAETENMKRMRPERGSHPAGAFWYYNNWDFNALGVIFTALTGKDVYSAFIERIARPIGMQDFDVGDYRYQYQAGSAFPAYHAYMTAHDLARFGLLYLRDGKWQDRQIVPESWVRESTRTHSILRSDGLVQADEVGEAGARGYGYLWWTGTNLLPNLKFEHPAFAAFGDGVQAVIVVPDKDLVIVHLVDLRDPTKSVSRPQLGRLIEMVVEAAPE